MGLAHIVQAGVHGLLAQVPVGRLALTLNALPVIFPVNYRFVGDSVVFGAMAGSSPSGAIDGAIEAFETDSYDQTNRSGCTVTAVGPAAQLGDAETIGRLDLDGVLPETWALGQSAEPYFRIGPDGVSGHRIV